MAGTAQGDMTELLVNPGIFIVDLPPIRDTWEGVNNHFFGKPATAETRAEAWAWWERLCADDYYQDCATFEREGAKVALINVITQCALLALDASASFQLVRYRAPKFMTGRWPARTLRGIR